MQALEAEGLKATGPRLLANQFVTDKQSTRTGTLA